MNYLEGSIKELFDFKANLFVDVELRKCTSKYIRIALLIDFLIYMVTGNKTALKHQNSLTAPS